MWLVILGFLVFRWPLLERFIGTIRMFLFDAIMFTFFAAMNFAQPQPYPWLSYIVGCLSIYWAFSAGRNYLKYDAIQRAENEQGKSNGGSAEGS